MGHGPPATPPQWAPDPTASHAYRYWDGDRWTDDVSDDGDPPDHLPNGDEPRSPPAAMAAPVATEATNRSELVAQRRHREKARVRRWFWFGVVAGAGLLAAGVVVAVLVFNVKIYKASPTSNRAVGATPITRPATTTTVNPGRPAAQVHLVILNGSGVPRAAGAKAFALAAIGYQVAATGNATNRQGNVVECKPGLQLEAATLAKNVGAGTTVAPFPSPAPPQSASADCVVVLGQ